MSTLYHLYYNAHYHLSHNYGSVAQYQIVKTAGYEILTAGYVQSTFSMQLGNEIKRNRFFQAIAKRNKTISIFLRE